MGNGREGDGIKIVADGSRPLDQTSHISNVNIEHVGGIGLDVIGNVSGTVFDSWMHGNAPGRRPLRQQREAARPTRSTGWAAASARTTWPA